MQVIFKSTAVEVLDVIGEKYPTFEKLSKFLKEGDTDFTFLRDDIRVRVDQALARELEMIDVGYDTMMPKFINYRSKAGEKLFNKIFTKIIDKMHKEGIKVSLIFFDLDDFKGVNDYGQHVGNEVLTHMAELIPPELRKNDICVRYGGEEVVLLLSDADIHSSGRVALRIQEKIQKNPMYMAAEFTKKEDQMVGSITKILPQRYLELKEGYDEKTIQRRAIETDIPDPRDANREIRLLKIPITASVGIVEVDKDHDDPFGDAVERSNAEEKKAKENGKNQVWALGQQVTEEWLTEK